MSTTVRLDATHKERLSLLQDLWRRRRGRRPSQQDLLGELIDHAMRDPGAYHGAPGEPWSEEQIQTYYEQTARFRFEASSEDIDSIYDSV